MVSFSVDPVVVAGALEDMQTLQNQIDESMGTLNQAVSAFINANQGDAVTEYQSAQLEWNEGLAQMQRALGKAQTSLSNIDGNYKLGQQQGVNLFGSR
ncbi:WXG100 family type VII secretion target [Catenuloplanes japonicus]|uniref:WXG100 family type VII secretion target n=1 Tax=Catenuloplanes japonicus TaxID=33876 RepID=UPI000524C897|nr:WXG100 family type VII secretion target [Catenuloplanes japonicus]